MMDMNIKEFAGFALDGLLDYANRIFEFATRDAEHRDELLEEYHELEKKAEYLKAVIAIG